MSKYHFFISIGISLAYLILLQELSVPQPIFRFLLPAVLLFSLIVSAYNYWHLKKNGKYNFWLLVRQLMLLLSAFAVFLLIPSAGLRGVFLITAVLFIALFEYSLGSFAENISINETLLIAFACFVFFAASSQYFPSVSLPAFAVKLVPSGRLSLQPVYLAGIFFTALLLARSFYELVPKPPRIRWIHALAIALFCTEIFWSLNFLPFHYSALAVLLFNVFYFCLILNYYSLFQTLSFKKIQFHLVLILICSGLVLLITPWKLIS